MLKARESATTRKGKLVVPDKPILGPLPSIKPRQLRKLNDFCVPVSCKTSPQ